MVHFVHPQRHRPRVGGGDGVRDLAPGGGNSQRRGCVWEVHSGGGGRRAQCVACGQEAKCGRCVCVCLCVCVCVCVFVCVWCVRAPHPMRNASSRERPGSRTKRLSVVGVIGWCVCVCVCVCVSTHVFLFPPSPFAAPRPHLCRRTRRAPASRGGPPPAGSRSPASGAQTAGGVGVGGGAPPSEGHLAGQVRVCGARSQVATRRAVAAGKAVLTTHPPNTHTDPHTRVRACTIESASSAMGMRPLKEADV